MIGGITTAQMARLDETLAPAVVRVAWADPIGERGFSVAVDITTDAGVGMRQAVAVGGWTEASETLRDELLVKAAGMLRAWMDARP